MCNKQVAYLGIFDLFSQTVIVSLSSFLYWTVSVNLYHISYIITTVSEVFQIFFPASLLCCNQTSSWLTPLTRTHKSAPQLWLLCLGALHNCRINFDHGVRIGRAATIFCPVLLVLLAVRIQFVTTKREQFSNSRY
jgi:hypothetical protein